MRLIVIFFSLSILAACGGSVNSGAVAQLEGYDTEIVKGTNITKAIKKDNAGDVVETGYVSNAYGHRRPKSYHRCQPKQIGPKSTSKACFFISF